MLIYEQAGEVFLAVAQDGVVTQFSMKKATDNLLPTDLSALKSSHQLVRNDGFDEQHCDDWRVRMARRYYNQLYKEFAIIDLSRYKEGKYGLRWRTEKEVLNTKGQKVCGSKHCEIAEELNVYELPFKYVEDGEVKRELIKVCLCSACSAKLNYGKSETPVGGERQKVDASKQKGKRTAPDVEGNTHKKGRT